ncbi:MAG: group I truncated hemoglobin [Myxococcota bacterium]
MSDTLYERLGGRAAVDAAVDIFYRNVLSDDRIAHFFDTVDMDEQIAKQKAFLTVAFGGPNDYDGKDLAEAHAHMDLTDEHFDAVAEALVGALEELDVPQEQIDEVVAVAESTRPAVLGRLEE